MEVKKRASRAKKVAVAAPVIPAIFIEEMEAVVPSPKPKGKKVAAAEEKTNDANKTNKTNETNAIEPVITKGKSRKPAVVASVTPDGIQGSLVPEQRPLIAHLQIHDSDIDNDLFAPTPSQPSEGGQPKPFDSDETFAVYGGQTVAPPLTPVLPEPATPVARPSLPLHYFERLMVRFQDANRDQRLPESTDVACFWDCQTFRTPPCIIPTMIEEGIWRVYGNFCCPECAAAYLFNERLDMHVQWERYALLNRLYSSGSETVRLAPARSILRLFGGPMDISDFRAIVADKRMRVDVMTPPMISIIQVMDTKPIDFYDASMKNTFIPWEMDRMNRPGAQGLRLRRTKPVAEKEATLEFCMGITA